MRACITAIAASVLGLVVGILLFDRGPGIEHAALAATLADGILRRGRRNRGRGDMGGAGSEEH